MKREQQRLLSGLKKELAAAEKTLTKGLGFKRSHDFIYCFQGDFAYWVSEAVTDDCSFLSAGLSVKCLLLDPLFWDIFEMPNNRSQPKSFHLHGAFVSPLFSLPNGYEAVLENGMENAYIDILTQAKQGIEQYSASLRTVADFQNLIKDNTYQKLNYILTEIYLGHKKSALDILSDAIAKHETGGFSDDKKSFYEYAVAYLEDTK